MNIKNELDLKESSFFSFVCSWTTSNSLTVRYNHLRAGNKTYCICSARNSCSSSSLVNEMRTDYEKGHLSKMES